MYNPPSFLTSKVLEEVVSEFTWPAPYIIGDDDCSPDGIEVRFADCILYFQESFESEINLYFIDPSQIDEVWTFYEAIYCVLEPEHKQDPRFIAPKLNNYFSPFASLEKVKNGIRDNCILFQKYLLPCINGDFCWVNRYKAKVGKQR